MAKLLKQQYPDYKISTIVIPNFIIGLMARFQAPMKVLNTMIGLKYHRDNTKAKKSFGMESSFCRGNSYIYCKLYDRK